MLDKKVYTFMKLCELMSYRATAEELHMTQPAVTQQIQSLEREYDCRLFTYKNRTLEKTKQAVFLENVCRSSYYNETIFREYLEEPQKKNIRIGATKTIGGYVISNKIISLASDDNIILSVYVENTQNLLDLLDHAQIDFAMVEGPFDKCKYDSMLMKKERFLGICSKDHPFANKKVPFPDMVNEKIILREEGSGTRDIFEKTLSKNNYSIDYFQSVSSSSSFEIIKKIVGTNHAITFAYKDIAQSDSNLTTFVFTDEDIYGEFNYVYLKNSLARALVDQFIMK